MQFKNAFRNGIPMSSCNQSVDMKQHPNIHFHCPQPELVPPVLRRRDQRVHDLPADQRDVPMRTTGQESMDLQYDTLAVRQSGAHSRSDRHPVRVHPVRRQPTQLLQFDRILVHHLSRSDPHHSTVFHLPLAPKA